MARLLRIRRRGGVLHGLPPESFEEFVGPAPEEHGVGSRHARRGGLGLLDVGHDPVQVAVGTREVAIGGGPGGGEEAARGSQTCRLPRRVKWSSSGRANYGLLTQA